MLLKKEIPILGSGCYGSWKTGSVTLVWISSSNTRQIIANKIIEKFISHVLYMKLILLVNFDGSIMKNR